MLAMIKPMRCASEAPAVEGSESESEPDMGRERETERLYPLATTEVSKERAAGVLNFCKDVCGPEVRRTTKQLTGIVEVSK